MQRTQADLDGWRALLTDEAAALVREVCALPDPDTVPLAALERLRQLAAADQVARALELARARRRASRKIDHADRLLADVEGVEQATGTRVARHKARRFAELAPTRLIDLCCGIGGDAIELCRALPTAEVEAVDLDPVRALMAEHNAGCGSRVADAARVDLGGTEAGGAAFHIDPSRRVEGGGPRLRRLADYVPGRDVLARLVASGAPGALKLGPGLPLDEVPEPDRTELEFVGDRDGLQQAVLWCGALAAAPGQRTATRIDAELSFTARPTRIRVDDGGVRGFVLVPDPALERAGLLGARAPEGVGEIAAGLGLLAADAAVDDPWFRSFEVLEQVAWRDKQIRAALRAHDAGVVRVKIRGKVADANTAERAFRGDGSAELWLLGFRIGPRAVAVVAREVAAAVPDQEPSR